ncbi:MAG TPA: hypothetical protein VL549_07760 [Gemmatimonadales bacterium]|jgi:hypothetical protein|nr:hypothetical protein [Gemmatimonadales bacterium]
MTVAPSKPQAPATPSTSLTGQHPRGTLFLVGLYGVVFAAAWFAMYFFVYLHRGGVTR